MKNKLKKTNEPFPALILIIFFIVLTISYLVPIICNEIKAENGKEEASKKNKIIPLIIDNSTYGKLSLTQCKNILNTNGMFYTDDEIIEIRNWLYHIADIALDAS